MPEWIASYWMTHALVSEFPNSNIVFEGVARKPNEAELFDEIHHWLHRPYVVFHLNISDQIVYERSHGRSRDAIDLETIVAKRLHEYQTYTAKSIEFFRDKGVLVDIDGTLPITEVKQQVINYLIS
jgi:adenylate kinase family enzyme